eukprot:CAMPEP_0177732832 /NCGR_PEP_ID=MMETSP0484_2-20121128/23339_1 /TAXON_ID=354590 /ORGANISM="Rhodomonas lens, Strain RHODO" /LENGTH=107 /DNA_ID=CAMNT_0019246127 /DNA_START=218 /DNA_END=538 /DNA_ORIENTATION=+
MRVSATSERRSLIPEDYAPDDRTDRVTHRRVVIGAFILAVICSILAFTLLFIWSDGLKSQLQHALRKKQVLAPDAAARSDKRRMMSGAKGDWDAASRGGHRRTESTE